ncbi:MAG: hypothetical protein NWF06_00780, partial [Candidatus Bathyarchaeota archaeon]|nr:hypothetical protein [Candidatus Bathyarchaeum sp.]
KKTLILKKVIKNLREKVRLFKKLEQRTALRILFYLKTIDEPAHLSKIMKGIKVKDARVVGRGIANLVELNLIIDHGWNLKGQGSKRLIELTSKGKKVAQKIEDIHQILLE